VMADKRREKAWRELLNSYYDGELSAKQRRKVEKALSSDEDMRAELSGLEEAASLLGSMEREAAPAGLSESVMFRLERDLILEGREGLNESAGRRHLFLRRLTAAAAVVLLTLGVGAFVYSVLVQPAVGPRTPEGAVVVDAGEKAPGSVAAKRAGVVSEAADDEALLASVEPAVYGSVQLAVRTEGLGRAQLQMEGLLDEYDIGPVVRSALAGSEEGVLYGFMCRPAALEGIVEGLARKGGHVDLLIEAPDGGVAAVSGVSVEEVLAWAGADEGRDRAVLAQRLARAAPGASEALAAEWLEEIAREDKGGLPGVRLLGPREFESDEPVTGAGSVAANQGSGVGVSEAPGAPKDEVKPAEGQAEVGEGGEAKVEEPGLVAVQIRVVREAAEGAGKSVEGVLETGEADEAEAWAGEDGAGAY